MTEPTPINNTDKHAERRAARSTIALLAGLLEHLENGGEAADARQYRLVVKRLVAMLPQVELDDGMRAFFAHHPATAELYENLHYAHAGLCLRELDRSIRSESLALQAISKARGRTDHEA